MKKLILLTLTMVLAVSVFASCSGGTEETTLQEETTTAVLTDTEPEIHSASAGTESASAGTESASSGQETATEGSSVSEENTSSDDVFYVG